LVPGRASSRQSAERRETVQGSFTGWKQSRGPAAVERNVSSHGKAIIWLKGMSGVAILAQPIWMRRPSRVGMSL